MPDLESAASLAYLDYLAGRQEAALEAIQPVLRRKVEPIFRYRLALNGFALDLTPTEAVQIAALPGVAVVQPDEVGEFQTDFGPGQMGAPALWDGSASGGVGTKGEGVVVGVIDSGINYRHPSFADVGADGYNHPNPRGRFYGNCNRVTGAPYCNDKLLGVYDFTGTTGGVDDEGHGSHVAAIAAGNFVDVAYPETNSPLRRLSGVAPHAHLIVYKTSVNGSSLHSRIVAAYEQAIADGVDVITYSISGNSVDFWRHAVAQAQLSAHAAGIMVAAAAGNAGPFSSAHMNSMPWVMTVGATTHRRAMPNFLTDLSGGATTPPTGLRGAAMAPAYGPARILHAAAAGDAFCARPFAAGAWSDGPIVVCDRGLVPISDKAANVQAGGGSYMVLANTADWGEATLESQPGFALPLVHLGNAAATELRTWLAAGDDHRGAVSAPVEVVDTAFADRVAWFSSRGPNPYFPDLLKPDLTAPGAYIVAADYATTSTPPATYAIKSGTSMATPHAAGAAALLIGLHPNWPPSAIQSALMSTARPDLLWEDGNTQAAPFDAGAGRIDLPRAAQAGLVLLEDAVDFQAADPDDGGDPRALNLASLANAHCTRTCQWTRTLTSVSAITITWQAEATGAGFQAMVTPTQFTLPPGASQAITVTVVSTVTSDAPWRFGAVTFHPSASSASAVRLTIAVRPTQALYLPLVISAGTTGWITLMHEDFEGVFPGPGWEHWDNGWAKSNCLPYGGVFSGWAVGESGSGGPAPCSTNYPNDMFSWLVYGPFSLADADDAVIDLAYWLNTEEVNDVLFWGVSIDKVNFYGRRNWGASNGWQPANFDLTDVHVLGDLRGQARVWFALQFWSNGSINLPGGAFVDDIVLRKHVSPAGASTRKAAAQGDCDAPENATWDCAQTTLAK